MKLNIPRLVLVVTCCVKYVSSEGFCETYWRDQALVLGCVGYTDTIQCNVPLEGVTEVNLIKNHIITLSPRILADFTLARKLFLTFNAIEQVEEDCFKNFTNVASINLSFNNIKDLPEALFQNNYNLLDISLRRNAIKTLKERMLSKLLELKTIDLSFNAIEHLPQNLFVNNVDLELMDLRENLIRDLPEEIFFDLAALREIDLSYNHLENLPPHLFKYNFNLEVIRVRGNKIKVLDYSVTHLNLKVFDLFKNPLLMDHAEVKETLTALERTGVKLYLKVHSEKHGHGHKKESDVTVPTYIKTILVLLMFVVTLLLVAISGLIVAFFTKIHKKPVRQNTTCSDSQECLIAEDNYLKLKVPNGTAVYVKNSQCSTSSTVNENGRDEVYQTSCDAMEMKSPIV